MAFLISAVWRDSIEYWHVCHSKFLSRPRTLLLGGTMPTLGNKSPVTEIAPADPTRALKHFERLFEFETDCWDVHAALTSSAPDFVLLDVRGPEHFRAGHIAGAVNLPHARIVERNLAEYPAGTVFVVYCAGPHCNGADRAAVRLARLDRAVKKMVGGVTGWSEEGFALATGPSPEE
jgi:rhodanese-related sulfurtransferase